MSAYAGGPAVGTLTSNDGYIRRIDDHNVVLNLSATLTALLVNSSAVIDLARVDDGGGAWLGMQVTLPVVNPVTPP